jgi:hypothetical protein
VFTTPFGTIVLNLFRGVDATALAGRFVALYTTTPGADGTGGVEVAAAEYVRRPVSFAAPAGNPLQIVSDAEVAFAVAVAGWGNITAVALHEAQVGGTPVAVAVLVDGNGDPAPVAIGANIQPYFAAGALAVRLAAA